MKKRLVWLLALSLVLGLFSGCTRGLLNSETSSTDDTEAATESAYGYDTMDDAVMGYLELSIGYETPTKAEVRIASLAQFTAFSNNNSPGCHCSIAVPPSAQGIMPTSSSGLASAYSLAKRSAKQVSEKGRSGLMGRNILCHRPLRKTFNRLSQLSRGCASSINPLPAALD